MTERHERFRRIYDANYASILGYALRRADAADDAHDIVSDTFLTAWRRLEDVPDGEQARLWLYGTARRTLANHYRGRRRQRRLVVKLRSDVPRLSETTSAPDDPDTGRIAAAFSKLSTSDQELLLLVGWEELDTQQLAAVLGCKPTAARVRLHRARRRFARELERLGVKRMATPGHERGGWATARPDPEEAL